MRILKVIAILTVILFPLPLSAQVTPADQQRALESLHSLEQKQQNQIKQFDADQQRKQRERTKATIEVPAPETKEIKGGPCFQVKSVTLNGANHLSKQKKQALVAPYLGTCMDIAAINHLIREVTNVYIGKGYVTTRLAIPPQNLKDGSLELKVVEGTVESIALNNDSWRDRMQRNTAFPFLQGEVLNLRDIEQGLDQLSRLASGRATMELLPGKEVGGTHIAVTDKPEGRTRASIGVDNSGQESTGKLKAFGSVEQDNLFGIGDYWALNYNRDTEANSREKKSEIFSGSLSIPYGYWTFSSNISHSEYLTTIVGNNQSFTSSGESDIYGIKADRVVYRNQDSKTSVVGGLTLKDTKNFIEDAVLDSGGNLSIARIEANHTHRALGGVLYLATGYERGLDAFGARKDADGLTGADPVAQFNKLTLDTNLYRPFAIMKQSFAYRLSGFGQYSPDTLFSSERITLGDRFTVRGFQQDSVSGDSGGYVRNEFMYNPPAWTDNHYAMKLIGGVQPYVGLDAGAVHVNSGEGSGSVTGWVAGLRNTSDWLMFDAAYARSISAPSFFTEDNGEFYFSVATKATF